MHGYKGRKMTSEEECKDLFLQVIENYKDYHLEAVDRDRFRRAEREIQGDEVFGEQPYTTLVRILFATLEVKARQAREKLLDLLNKTSPDKVSVHCVKLLCTMGQLFAKEDLSPPRLSVCRLARLTVAHKKQMEMKRLRQLKIASDDVFDRDEVGMLVHKFPKEMLVLMLVDAIDEYRQFYHLMNNHKCNVLR